MFPISAEASENIIVQSGILRKGTGEEDESNGSNKM